jgi:AhpD family alkylhydroperoxidase
MVRDLIRMAGRKALVQVRYVAPVHPSMASGLVADVYQQVERDFGLLAPPVALHSPAPGPLAASWLMLRETLLAGAGDRPGKEAVAAAVSFGNICPYCVQVHASLLHGLVRSRDAAAIEIGRIASVADQRIRWLGAWASAGGRTADNAGEPFPSAQRAEFIGVAVTFHYLNRMVNVFLGDPPLPQSLPSPMRGGAMRLMGNLLRPVTRKQLASGASLGLLPEAALPGDLSWAATSPVVAVAFARAAAAIDQAAADALPQPVRDLVLVKIACWKGRSPAPGRAWVDATVSGLADGQRPAARLALLTALASYQVSPADIDQARQRHPDDAALIGLTSWASLAAARHAGQVLAGQR